MAVGAGLGAGVTSEAESGPKEPGTGPGEPGAGPEEPEVVVLKALAGPFFFCGGPTWSGELIRLTRDGGTSLGIPSTSGHLRAERSGEKTLGLPKRAGYTVGYRALRIVIKLST